MVTNNIDADDFMVTNNIDDAVVDYFDADDNFDVDDNYFDADDATNDIFMSLMVFRGH